MKYTKVTAHAGCLGTQKDSIDSVLSAILIGADIAEVDVNCLDDGTAVLKNEKTI